MVVVELSPCSPWPKAGVEDSPMPLPMLLLLFESLLLVAAASCCAVLSPLLGVTEEKDDWKVAETSGVMLLLLGELQEATAASDPD